MAPKKKGDLTAEENIPDKDEQEHLRTSIWKVINLIQANQLYVHSRTLTIRLAPKKKKVLPEILTICVLNALTPNSAMLLIGGHGGGKTSLVKILGRMLTGLTLRQVEEGIIRGHPQLTEEKIIATLNIAKLLKGEEEVKWRDFIRVFWKIVDEVNRLTPYAQDILLSLLAEGRVKYYDAVKEIPQYCLFATINPQDAGTFELALPFLDRFGLSIPISMPTSHDLAIILNSQDEKYHGYDELVQVPKILEQAELMEIWYFVDRVKVTLHVDNFIHAIVREFSLCDRIDKGNAERLKPGSGLCNGCHFDVEDSVCNKVESILSVRVAKDLLRYGKALTWLLGLPEVMPNVVLAVAPYVVAHRSKFVERELTREPFFGDRFACACALLDLVRKRFNIREPCYGAVEAFRIGTGTNVEMGILENFANNDLIVKHDLLPLAYELNNDAYIQIVGEIAGAKNDALTLQAIQSQLLTDLEFPNRGDLIAQINRLMFAQTLRSFKMPYKTWAYLWPRLGVQFPGIEPELRQAATQLYNKQIRTEQMVLEVHVMGLGPEDTVSLDVFGGGDALAAASTIEKTLHEDLYEVSDLLEELDREDVFPE